MISGGDFMDWIKLKKDIDEAVADVCIQIIKEPLVYFSEADIQQLLAEKLRKIKQIGKAYPTSVHKGKGSKSVYSTSLLHREYGGGERTRIDVMIFDPDDVKNIDDVNLKIKGHYLEPVYAFELGTEKINDIRDHVANDLKKLSKCRKKNGVRYLIHFYKDVTQAPTGTISRDKTESKIEREFKQVFNTIQIEQSANIKILAILLRTYRNQSKMRGKCRIFDGQKWIPTNVGNYEKLRSAILARLDDLL
jgi:hypothetical protein